MATFVKAGNRLINLENVAHIRVWPPEGDDEKLMVDVATAATAGEDRDGSEVEVIIVLEEGEAAEFLRGISMDPYGAETAADIMGVG